MENLDVKVKDLSDENDQLRKENSKLLTRINTLELENKLLKQYTSGNSSSQPRKPIILMGIVLLVVFNVFTLK
jgi:regulator of replication initiation timing